MYTVQPVYTIMKFDRQLSSFIATMSNFIKIYHCAGDVKGGGGMESAPAEGEGPPPRKKRLFKVNLLTNTCSPDKRLAVKTIASIVSLKWQNV